MLPSSLLPSGNSFCDSTASSPTTFPLIGSCLRLSCFLLVILLTFLLGLSIATLDLLRWVEDMSSPDGRPPKGESGGWLGFGAGLPWFPFRMACRRSSHSSRGTFSFRVAFRFQSLLTNVIRLRPGHTEGEPRRPPPL